ncbi:YeeE/YedE family protein [Mesorhizobium sp. Z1-4]|uniref:YeeE/YedE family protein n=1 Tax=Mesorhizobium sp. Z1-4 TaxID=2448478 RepID=UPI001FDF8380|nr:YeeE/YedE family protein [Mesorhizobium sp. Z1-4]
MGSITEFTPWLSLAGGALIGLSAVLLMALHGRVAGMTAILGGVLPPVASDWQWRAAFLAGAIIAPVIFVAAGGEIGFAVPPSTGILIAGGVIVGIGVTFGSGCTSGHGVCGMARLSPRSIAATAIFMVATFASVYVIRHVIGG